MGRGHHSSLCGARPLLADECKGHQPCGGPLQQDDPDSSQPAPSQPPHSQSPHSTAPHIRSHPLHSHPAPAHSQVYLISWDALHDSLVDFPASAAHIRGCAIRLAMRRQIVRVAKLAMRQKFASILEIDVEDLQSGDAVSECPPSAIRHASMRRSRTLKKMMETSTESVSAAEVSLQKHLMVRRCSTSSDLILAGPGERAAGGSASGSSSRLVVLPTGSSQSGEQQGESSDEGSSQHDPGLPNGEPRVGKTPRDESSGGKTGRGASSSTDAGDDKYERLAKEVGQLSRRLDTMGSSMKSIATEMNRISTDAEPIQALTAEVRELLDALQNPKSPMTRKLSA